MWEDWQLKILDDYILNYVFFENQEDLADKIGKPLNAVKIKLYRRRKELEEVEKRELSINEYKLFLSNRFDKTTEDIAKILNVSRNFLLNELDEIDCLECSEYLLENFKNRDIIYDEIIVLCNLIKKGNNKFQIAHILNRPINIIQELMETYG